MKKLILQHGSNQKFDYPLITCGKSGHGFYAYFRNSYVMRNYYDKGSIAEFCIEKKHLVDLTVDNNYLHCKAFIENQLGKKISKSTFQSSGNFIQFYLKRFFPEAKAFINFHFGANIPNSKEVVIIDTEIIEDFHWIK